MPTRSAGTVGFPIHKFPRGGETTRQRLVTYDGRLARAAEDAGMSAIAPHDGE
jgi:hypothetical protein